MDELKIAWQQKIKQQQVPQALIVVGENTNAKTEFIEWMAAQLLELEVVSDKSPVHPDLFWLAPEKSIGIDAISDLQLFLAQKPVSSRYKVAVLLHSERLTHSAFNALLKWTEEPPLHTTLIFSTASTTHWPLTLKSRCMVWRWTASSVCFKTQFTSLYETLYQRLKNQESMYPAYTLLAQLAPEQGLGLIWEVILHLLKEHFLSTSSALSSKITPLLHSNHIALEHLKKMQAGFTLNGGASLYASIFAPWEKSVV